MIPRKITRLLLLVGVLLIALSIGCASGDDDDDDNDDDGAPDDDDDDNNDDNDDSSDWIVPTTLDVTLVPTAEGDTYVLGEGPGELHQERNDLGVVSGTGAGKKDRLSMAYLLALADTHQADEESPTRLSFFSSWYAMFGMFESFFRPHEDLAPHQLNAMVRTANKIQVNYDRDFDLALLLGDGTDNGQKNEFQSLLDVLDGAGLTAGDPGRVRPDSGDLLIDPDSGLNLGERDFGVQETDDQGSIINVFHRPEFPNSNADFFSDGLRTAEGQPVPWFFTIGNHDVLNNGGFVPGGALGYHTLGDYTGDHSLWGYIPGIGALARYLKDNPTQAVITANGFFGLDLSWRSLLWLITLNPEWEKDVDPRFDLMVLLNDTPEDPEDDGVFVTPDENREFLGRDGIMQLMNAHGHGFFDNNQDGQVNEDDGGWYRMDPMPGIPLRFLVLDTMDLALVSEGGVSQAQLDWLQDQLDQAVPDAVLVVLVSHHTELDVLLGGVRFESMLHACPNVILHLVGHRHHNEIIPHPAPSGGPLFGYWEVQTPSALAFPPQARIVEIVDNRDRTGTIYLTVFDFWPIQGDDPDELALLGRDLAFGDYLQLGYDGVGGVGGMGGPADRNAALRFALPGAVADRLAQIESDGFVTSTDSLGQRYSRGARSR